MKAFNRIAVAAATVALAIAGQAQANTVVDVELQLLVDVSGSVSAGEYALQRDGYVAAFQDAAIQNAILNTDGGRVGKIAAQFIVWSSSNEQAIGVDWTLIDSAQAANDFATAISGVARTFSGLTAPGSAINFGAPLFDTNAFDGAFQVIDVSGDGQQNDGANTATARNNALANGIDRINGIAIGDQSLVNWYAANIVGGTDSFVLQAANFADFEDAVATKIKAEIEGTDPTNPIPLPAAAWMLLSGIGAMGALRLRKRA